MTRFEKDLVLEAKADGSYSVMLDINTDKKAIGKIFEQKFSSYFADFCEKEWHAKATREGVAISLFAKDGGKKEYVISFSKCGGFQSFLSRWSIGWGDLFSMFDKESVQFFAKGDECRGDEAAMTFSGIEGFEANVRLFSMEHGYPAKSEEMER